MKKVLIAILVMISSTSFFAQKGTITVKVVNLKNTKGIVRIGLYSNQETFPIYGKHIEGALLKIETTDIEYTFNNIPIGKYAIAVWHDENNNEKIDKNFFGIPKEKYGFSNNKFGLLGPPKFEDASINIEANDNTTLTIKLK